MHHTDEMEEQFSTIIIPIAIGVAFTLGVGIMVIPVQRAVARGCFKVTSFLIFLEGILIGINTHYSANIGTRICLAALIGAVSCGGLVYAISLTRADELGQTTKDSEVSKRDTLVKELENLSSAIRNSPPVVIGSQVIVSASPGSGNVIGKQVTVKAGPGSTGTIVGEQITVGGPNSPPPVNNTKSSAVAAMAEKVKAGSGTKQEVRKVLEQSFLPGPNNLVNDAIAKASVALEHSDLP